MDIPALILSLAVIDPICLYPPLEDRHRFPPAETCREAKRLNLAHRDYLAGRLSWDFARADLLREIDREARWCFDCWDWAFAAAGGEGRDPRYWRYSLWRLRELIGRDAYYAGELPPAVPVWRFRVAD